MKPFLFLIAFIVSLILGGCGGGGDNSGQTTEDNNTNPGNATNRLKAATSSAELEAYLKQLLLNVYGQERNDIVPLAVDDSKEAADDPAATFNPNTSTTNLQENQVDEADRIKAAGNYLYIASQDAASIQVYQAQQGNTIALAQYNLPENSYADQGLYLSDQQLITIGARQDSDNLIPVTADWLYPEFWREQKTSLLQLDISNPVAPSLRNQLVLEGYPISSRRINQTIYLALRHTPTLTGLIEYPENAEEVTHNRNLIHQATLSDFLPDYSLNQQNQGDQLAAEQCFIINTENATQQQASLISLLAVDLSGDTPTIQGQCFAGDAETLYASTNAIYLATTQSQYIADEEGFITYTGELNTDIHKFALVNGQINYRASGRVSGHLGWQQDLKPFRMSEHENVLRVITYTDSQLDSNNTSSPARLHTLQESSAEQSLEVLATLPNANRPTALGKPGEQIYATRFIGERAYLVTFRVTDPLYILNLSNPADPFIISELEIEGYSDYLHPVNEHYLLGIGKDAVADTNANIPAEERGAWYQGVKVSLIDLSDPSSPFEKDQLIIGKRGTETAVSFTHHGFTSLNNNNRLQVAMPVSRHENPNRFSDPSADDPSYFYGWTQDELYRLEVDTNNGTLNMLPSLIGFTNDLDENNNYSPNAINQQRSVMIDGYVYYLQGDQISATAW